MRFRPNWPRMTQQLISQSLSFAFCRNTNPRNNTHATTHTEAHTPRHTRPSWGTHASCAALHARKRKRKQKRIRVHPWITRSTRTVLTKKDHFVPYEYAHTKYLLKVTFKSGGSVCFVRSFYGTLFSLSAHQFFIFTPSTSHPLPSPHTNDLTNPPTNPHNHELLDPTNSSLRELPYLSLPAILLRYIHT